MNRSRLLAVALVATLGCAAAAQAQPAGPPAAPQAGAMAGPMAGRGFDPGRMRQHMEAEHAEHIKALHQALNIRPDQEAAFNAYAAAMHPEAHDDWRKHDAMEPAAMASMTTPQRLDHMAQVMDERSARMREEFQRKATATKALYAALSPDQRRTMDALHDLMGHGGHGGHGGHEGRGRGPGPGHQG